MDHSDDKTQAAASSEQAADVGTPGPSQGRRRLLRGGLIGAPALLALTSTPVQACNCKKPSGFSVSGNFSRTKSKNCAAPGKKPSGWKSSTYNGKYNGCTNPYVSKTDLLSSKGFNKGSYTDRSFDSALGLGDKKDQALIAAVYLEAVANPGANFPTPTMVQKMWNDGVIGSGGYQPISTMPSVRWYKTDVLNYLLYLTAQAT